MRHVCSIRIHRNKAGKGMKCRTTVLIAGIMILAVEESGVARELEPRTYLHIHLCTCVERVIIIRSDTEDTILMIVSAADHIRDILGATAHRHVIVLCRTALVIHIVIPVKVGKIKVFKTSVTHLSQHPWAVRMLSHIVSSIPKTLIVIACVIRIRDSRISLHEQVCDLRMIVASSLIICRSSRCRE